MTREEEEELPVKEKKKIERKREEKEAKEEKEEKEEKERGSVAISNKQTKIFFLFLPRTTTHRW